MATLAELETRVEALERRVVQLSSGPAATPPRLPFQDLIGAFADDPAFAEAVRLGREYRASVRDPEPDAAP